MFQRRGPLLVTELQQQQRQRQLQRQRPRRRSARRSARRSHRAATATMRPGSSSPPPPFLRRVVSAASQRPQAFSLPPGVLGAPRALRIGSPVSSQRAGRAQRPPATGHRLGVKARAYRARSRCSEALLLTDGVWLPPAPALAARQRYHAPAQGSGRRRRAPAGRSPMEPGAVGASRGASAERSPVL
ncbi:hypothetical protein T492DRAFT_975167 [Pavlovales sp. CCMP2436]|nr:hypothetical protein T492DRAFT_975167 [Pavlovales sp. CCMP2436]